MVRFLLEKGANVDVQTSSGYTALHQAAQQGHTVVITLLLQSKASPNIQNMVLLSNIFSVELLKV